MVTRCGGAAIAFFLPAQNPYPTLETCTREIISVVKTPLRSCSWMDLQADDINGKLRSWIIQGYVMDLISRAVNLGESMLKFWHPNFVYYMEGYALTRHVILFAVLSFSSWYQWLYSNPVAFFAIAYWLHPLSGSLSQCYFNGGRLPESRRFSQKDISGLYLPKSAWYAFFTHIFRFLIVLSTHWCIWHMSNPVAFFTISSWKHCVRSPASKHATTSTQAH